MPSKKVEVTSLVRTVLEGSYESAEVTRGEHWAGGGGSTAPAGNYPMVQLLNPAGSTVKLIVYNASASSSGVGFVHTAPYGVPLANLASTLYNKDFGYSGSPAFAEVRWGFSGALLGLAGPSRYVLARTEAPVFPGGEIHLSPGTGLLLGSGVVASTLLAAFEWREVPV